MSALCLTQGPGVGAADFAACRAWIQEHSKSFYLSSLLLPERVRREAWALYAFCRRADDAVDEDAGAGGCSAERALARVASLRARLDRVYAREIGERSDEAIDRAFLATVTRAGIPRGVPERLLCGMETDARGARMRTMEDLLGYCFAVGSTVGLMMTAVMGHRMEPEREPEVLLRAADLGVAMQLTNISRDVGEDARMGRVYLPDELLARCGTTREEVLAAAAALCPAPPPIRDAVAEILALADAHYLSAEAGIAMLPRACQLSIRSARLIYAAIGQRVRRSGYDSLTRRAFVPLPGKLWLVMRALGRTLVLRGPPPRRTSGPNDALLLDMCRAVDALSSEAFLAYKDRLMLPP